MSERIYSREKDSVSDFDSAKDFLFRRLQDTPKMLFQRGQGIERTKRWLETLDNPQEAFPSIHIAGTSGKGSVSYFISSILRAHGKNIGTHVSPHVYDVRERMLHNLGYIDEAEFTKGVHDIIPAIVELQKEPCGRPTYFEVTNALAMQTFRDKAVDYGVIETGLGGRYDSTNTIQRSDKLAVITRLGFDHTDILGNTLEEIAWQKAGILPHGGTAIALKPESPSVEKVLRDVAEERGTELVLIDPREHIRALEQQGWGSSFQYTSSSLSLDNVRLSTPGAYQAENAAMAMEVVKKIAERDGWEISSGEVVRGLSEVHLPGRADIWEIDRHKILVDSAHNPQKLEAFFGLVDQLHLDRKPNIVFAAKQGKDWQASLPLVSSRANHVYTTEFFNDQAPHLQRYSVSLREFQETADGLGLANVKADFEKPYDALRAALGESDSGTPVIVVGSMYMLGKLYDFTQQTQA